MAEQQPKALGLLADIGGTNARFAIYNSNGDIVSPMVLPCADYQDPSRAAEAYLSHASPSEKPQHGAFAIASPVSSDMVEMTNHVWKFSINDVREKLGFKKLDVINDFVAQALAVPELKDEELLKIGGGEPVDLAPKAVIGPGTGLGESVLFHTHHGWKAVQTEGGHVTMAPANAYESAILNVLRAKSDHISAERVISGSGLINLHNAIAMVKDNRIPEPLEAAEISERALSGDPECLESVEMMFAMLGTVAGNLALVTGSVGGIYIAGGIVPRVGMIDIFKKSKFRKRFESKGRFKEYMSKIPTYVVTSHYPAFLGLSSVLKNLLQ